jgi:proteic killer suppression protein
MSLVSHGFLEGQYDDFDMSFRRSGTDQILTLDNTNASRYYFGMPIRSFRCGDTQKLFEGKRIRRFGNIERVAMRKLAILNRAGRLDDLRVPPGNALEALKGSRSGQHSIRINDQFRLCFVWTAGGPKDVEIVDYH